MEILANKTDDELYKVLRNNPQLFKYVISPSEYLTNTMVGECGICIQWVENPSEELQILAVKNSASAIAFIDNPAVSTQLYIIKQCQEGIELIANSSKEAIELYKMLWEV